MPIMSHASKAIQAAYGVSVFKDIEIMELELSASLVDLILARIGEIREYGGIIIKKFIPDRDLYNWSKIDDGVDLSVFDSFGVRALLAAVRVCFKNDIIFIRKSDHADFEIKINEIKSSVFNEIVKQIVVWSNLMIRIENVKILVNSK